ncbi:MAG: transposase family protein [Anaerolineae bacterium]|nr:transposase family protein [Anaerolineae bacterium]
MITYEQLKQKPILFQELSGVSVVKFNELLQKLEPYWLRKHYQRLDRPDRRRCVGGGPDYKLKLKDRLLMTLMLLHLYLNTEALGFLFEVDKSTVSRNTRDILPALSALANGRWSRPPKRGEGKTVAQVLQEHPALLEIVDHNGLKTDNPAASVTQTLP